MKELGKRIAVLIEDRGYTVESFAEACGFTEQYVKDLISDKIDPTVSMLEKVVSKLDTTLPYLFYYGNGRPHNVLVTVNGEAFNMQSDVPITRNMRSDMESIASCLYDEDWEEYSDDIYDMDNFDIVDLYQRLVKKECGVTLDFAGVDLEIYIDE